MSGADVKPLLLEVIVQSVEDARAAARGGADRLEVVRELERDGLTPDVDLVRAIAGETGLPLRVMVRESDGFTIGGPSELLRLQRACAAFAALGVDGVVVGYARDGTLDMETTTAVLSVAPELCATFHRAFDAAADPLAALGRLAAAPQIDRLLTMGGTGGWEARCERLRQYGAAGGPRITVLAGGGIDEEGIRAIASARCVREVHVARAACEPPVTGAPVSEDRVRRLKALTR